MGMRPGQRAAVANTHRRQAIPHQAGTRAVDLRLAIQPPVAEVAGLLAAEVVVVAGVALLMEAAVAVVDRIAEALAV